MERCICLSKLFMGFLFIPASYFTHQITNTWLPVFFSRIVKHLLISLMEFVLPYPFSKTGTRTMPNWTFWYCQKFHYCRALIYAFINASGMYFLSPLTVFMTQHVIKCNRWTSALLSKVFFRSLCIPKLLLEKFHYPSLQISKLFPFCSDKLTILSPIYERTIFNPQGDTFLWFFGSFADWNWALLRNYYWGFQTSASSQISNGVSCLQFARGLLSSVHLFYADVPRGESHSSKLYECHFISFPMFEFRSLTNPLFAQIFVEKIEMCTKLSN